MTLRGLIEAVGNDALQPGMARAALGEHSADVVGAHFGSIDAAARLHDALLPGWFPGMSQNIHDGEWFAWVQNKAGDHFTSFGDNPARCWLLAILRALEAERDALRAGITAEMLAAALVAEREKDGAFSPYVDCEDLSDAVLDGHFDLRSIAAAITAS